MKDYRDIEKILVYAILAIIGIVYTVLLFLSEGTMGGADDINHYQLARYAFSNPEFFLDQWGKPVFTALAAPFAQLGVNGVRIFNVLAGLATAYLTYRMARELKLKVPVVVIFMIISSPLYAVLMISGMTEILFSLFLIAAIFLFYKQKYIWSALLLSFIPFVRTEGAVIIPLLALALAWQKQWKAIPFLLTGFVFYSIVGSFHFNDILWLIHKMPYAGDAADIYGSGELLHYVKNTRFIFGIPLAVLIVLGGVAWLTDPLVKKNRPRKDWLMDMLVVYLPFMAYYAAHSYVWWKGMGNSVGMIRVIVAVLPSAVLLAALGWGRLMELLPLKNYIRYILTGVLAIFLVIVPFKTYRIPVRLEGTQRIVKDASDWMRQSDYTGKKVYYFNPFFPHFLHLNPYDKAEANWMVSDREHPENTIGVGEMVIWDAHFGPNEGRLQLDNLLKNENFRLVHLTREKEPFTVLGGYSYEIYFFERVDDGSGAGNEATYLEMVEQVMAMDIGPYQSSDHLY